MAVRQRFNTFSNFGHVFLKGRENQVLQHLLSPTRQNAGPALRMAMGVQIDLVGGMPDIQAKGTVVTHSCF